MVRKGAFNIRGISLSILGIILLLIGGCFALAKDFNELFIINAFLFLFLGAVICLFIIIDSITGR